MCNEIVMLHVGILGHVDSGKTSLVESLISYGGLHATGSQDKNAESQRRGITTELGFSLLHLTPEVTGAGTTVECCLVDCPGHESYILTIANGIARCQAALIVVDCTKGLQRQTAESLILADVHCQNVAFVYTHMDKLSNSSHTESLSSEEYRLRRERSSAMCQKAAAKVFKRNLPEFFVSNTTREGFEDLLRWVARLRTTDSETTQSRTSGPEAATKEEVVSRACQAKLLTDHVFELKGLGTVITATVLEGRVCTGDQIHWANQQTAQIVRVQKFREEVRQASAGDRVSMQIHRNRSTVRNVFAVTSLPLCFPFPLPLFFHPIFLQNVHPLDLVCTGTSLAVQAADVLLCQVEFPAFQSVLAHQGENFNFTFCGRSCEAKVFFCSLEQPESNGRPRENEKHSVEVRSENSGDETCTHAFLKLRQKRFVSEAHTFRNSHLKMFSR